MRQGRMHQGTQNGEATLAIKDTKWRFHIEKH